MTVTDTYGCTVKINPLDIAYIRGGTVVLNGSKVIYTKHDSAELTDMWEKAMRGDSV